MKIISNLAWVHYFADTSTSLDNEKCGKWMYFFKDFKFASTLCQNAVSNGIVVEAKHSNAAEGVCCFYLNGDDKAGHKRVIDFFLKNNLVGKTKTGKFFNIPFKFDKQTRRGEYKEFGNFKPRIRLSDYLNLATGEFLS